MFRHPRRWQVAIGLLLGICMATAAAGQPDPAADDPFGDLDVPSAAPESALREPPSCRCVGEAGGPATRSIRKVLRSPLNTPGLDFVDTPLEEVLNFLQDDYDIPIQLDLWALNAIGLQSDEAVNITVRNVSLRSGLRLMLRQLQLTYIIRDEVLLITTPEEAEQHLTVCVYSVADIVDVTKAKEVRQLIDTIKTCISLETWRDQGGSGADIKVLPSGLVVVSQTQDIQEEIRELLILLKKMRPADGAGNARTDSDRRNPGAEAAGSPFADGPPNDPQGPGQSRAEGGGGFFRPAVPKAD